MTIAAVAAGQQQQQQAGRQAGAGVWGVCFAGAGSEFGSPQVLLSHSLSLALLPVLACRRRQVDSTVA